MSSQKKLIGMKRRITLAADDPFLKMLDKSPELGKRNRSVQSQDAPIQRKQSTVSTGGEEKKVKFGETKVEESESSEEEKDDENENEKEIFFPDFDGTKEGYEYIS